VKSSRKSCACASRTRTSATNRSPCSTYISRPWRGLAHRKQGRRSAKRRRTSGRSRRFGALGSHRLLQARPCEVAASSCAPLVDQRAQEAGWPTGDLENQIRGLAVVFGIRLPRALTAAFVNQALKASEGVAGLSAAMRGLIAARTAVMTAVAAIHADMRRMTDDVTTPSDRLRRNPQLIVKGDLSRREPFVAGRKALSAGPPGEAEVLPGTAIARARRDSKPKVAYTYRR
jgi:hypothetical protein